MDRSRSISQKLKRMILRLFILGIILSGAFITAFLLLGYFHAIKPQSYLPEINTENSGDQMKGAKRIGLKCPGYTVSVSEQGVVNITTPEDETVMSELLYYASYEGANEKFGLDDISVKLNNDSTILILGKGCKGADVEILLTVPEKGDRLDVGIKTFYTTSSLVEREALIAHFEVPVKEVYCKNGQVAVDSLYSEYWLNRQGVRFGAGSNSALVYHTPGLSSLQLDVKKNLLFLNLEYSMDHPHVNIPFQEDGGERGRWEDQSTADYKAGQVRNNNFSIYFNSHSEAIPRLMLVPFGYLAGYVFTEHADGGTIGSHRAVYFGSDTIKRANDAIGGFVGNRIPVTKSVFYADPLNQNHPSIRDDRAYPEYLDFLDQLYATGIYEICLHTPENLTSTRMMMEEAVRFMKDRFDAVTWIDHGMYGGKLNRETFVADGLNENSENYAADIWEKYETKYFWSPAVEMILGNTRERIQKLKLYEASMNFWSQMMSGEEIRKLGFVHALIELFNRYQYKSEMNSLMPFKGNAFPTPVYYQHLTRTRLFYSWATGKAVNYKNLWTEKAEDQYGKELKHLDELIKDRGIYINHGYYIRNLPGYDPTASIDGKVLLNPYFEKILEYMAKMRDDGDLYITTVRDLLDYWIMTENISFSYFPDGAIDVYNNNDKPIKGLSLIIKSPDVLVNGVTPKCRKAGDETIFWFDIGPGEHAILKAINENN
jgi:hypothetical protein